MFSGEREDVGLTEATGIFQEFLRGRTEWSDRFTSMEL
jgi:hypothetical protein